MTNPDRIEVIRNLTEAYGVPGNERSVREVLRSYIEPVSEEVVQDRFGGIVGKKVGQSDGPTILIAGHLDEVGMMVTHITDEGFIKFQPLGGWWGHVMLSQRVIVHTRHGELVGVIGSRPPHILSAEERNKVVKISDMFIDIGVKDREEAEKFGVRPGDPIIPWSPFTQLANEKFFLGKALDNRLGCATAVEVLRDLQGKVHPNILWSGATTQEEVGMRGATTLVNLVKPDLAIALDVGIAGDTPGMTKNDALSRCGDGPILVIFDASMIPNTRFRDFVLDTASDANIPLQVEVIPGGGTDAGKFSLHNTGVPSVAIGHSCRYIHSHTSIYHQDDFDNGVRLVSEIIQKLDRSIVQEIQQY